MPIRPRDLKTESNLEFGERLLDYHEELESDLHDRLAIGPKFKVYTELEDLPEQLEIWADLVKPDTGFAAPYTKGYMLYLEKHNQLLEQQLEVYNEPYFQGKDSAGQEQMIWNTLEEMILMMKAMQIAVTG